MGGLSPKDLINTEHIKNLIALAISHSKIDEIELDLIQKKAETVGIDPVELDQLLFLPKTELKFKVPSDPADAEAYLSEFVFMMMSEGKVHAEEYDICIKFAKQLKLGSVNLDQIIEFSSQLWDLDN